MQRAEDQNAAGGCVDHELATAPGKKAGCRRHGSVQMWQYVGTASTAAKGQGQPPDSREASFDAMHGLRMLLPH